MESLSLLGDGLLSALTPMNLLWVFIGAMLGTAVGVLPGLGSAMAVALLLPITFSLDPTSALIMFAGVYFGGMFGDATSAILLNTPGTSAAIATTFEGHKMALDGRAPQALATAAIGAFFGSIVAVMVVVFSSQQLVKLALLLGPEDYFAIAIFAFVATSAVLAESAIRGLTAIVIGLTIAMVGVEPISGATRLTGGVPEFFDGISIVVITVGILALGEVFKIASSSGKGRTDKVISAGRPWLSRRELRQAAPAWLRGTAFGLPFGVIPAGGAEIPTFLAFGTEKALDNRRSPRTFGTGAIQGVAAPEAAGNATAGTAMGAILALGLPTSATAAVLILAFQQYGLQPGPLLFEGESDLVWTLLASLLVGSVVLLVLNLGFAPLWAKLLQIPKAYLYAGISVFCALGVYATSATRVDLWLVLGIGLLGWVMRRYDIPLAPVLIAVVLGPLAENSFRQALAINQNDATVLISSPFAATLYILLIIGMIVAVVIRRRSRNRIPTSNAPSGVGNFMG